MGASPRTARRFAGWQQGFRALLALLALLPAAGAAHAQTLAGTVVTNVAAASFGDAGGTIRTTASNPVPTLVTAVCGLDLTPDGSLASPGHAVVARPGEIVVRPYLFQSTANLSADFDLAALLDPASALAPASIALHLDLNGDGVLDPGEPVVTELLGVAPGALVPLLLVVALADDAGVAGDVYVDVVGACVGAPATLATGHVARITVAREGVRAFVKGATPAPGSSLAPGAELTYTIGFTVNEFEMSDVVLSDPLDPLLEAPIALSVSLDGVAQPGLATYDPATRTVSAAFATLAPGTRVDLVVTTALRADAPAGAPVRNQAALAYGGGGDASNVVEHAVLGVCRLTIEPDGSVAAPGQTVERLAGLTAVLRYELRNLGNLPADVVLAATTLGASSVAPSGLRIVHDLDGNGSADAGEPIVTGLTGVPVGGSVALLLLVDLPAGAAVGGSVYVDLVGACADAPAVVDDGNVGRVVVADIGFDGPVKSATPPSGTPLYPGARLRYEIAFTAGSATLYDVVVRDALDPRLEPPSLVLEGAIVDPDSGLGAFATVDYVDGTLTWRLAEVPAGMTVTLSFETSVRRDAALGAAIDNRATVAAGAAGERVSDATRHPIEALALSLAKTAEPADARPGERLTYLLVAGNASPDVALPESELVDTLPEGVAYLVGSARVALADGSLLEREPEIDGGALSWRLPPLAPGERHEVRFDVRVLPQLPSGATLINRAELRAFGAGEELAAAAVASVATVVVPGVLSGRSLLLGTAFVDQGRDGLFDRGVDTPLAGLRLYLPDGRSTITDVDGRYTFPDLAPGPISLKLDATTLPPRWLERTPAEVTDGFWRLTLQPGAITRQDLPFAPPEVALSARERLTVVMGSVVLVKSWVESGAGAVEVVLEVASSEPRRGLVVVDALPQGARLVVAPWRPDGAALAFDAAPSNDHGVSLALGDVAADAPIEVRYTYEPASAATQLTPPPRIRWELRP